MITSYFSRKRKKKEGASSGKNDAKRMKSRTNKAATQAATAASEKESGASKDPAFHDLVPLEKGWNKHLGKEFRKDYMYRISSFLQEQRATIYPPREEIFRAFALTPFDDVRVVILGQDPYHGPGQAHGLAFSVKNGIKVPPSLRNMIKEASSNSASGSGKKVDKKKKGNGSMNGNLTKWAQQGVLLLNASLTVEHKKANSHAEIGWAAFTDAAIRAVSEEKEGVVFLLWGAFAAKKAKFVDKTRHCIIRTPHPSPLSAYRGFFGSGCFTEANEYLIKLGRRPIDWSV